MTLVSRDPGSNGSCPTNAQITGGVCACVTGYRASADNKNCGKIIHASLLTEYMKRILIYRTKSYSVEQYQYYCRCNNRRLQSIVF